MLWLDLEPEDKLRRVYEQTDCEHRLCLDIFTGTISSDCFILLKSLMDVPPRVALATTG